MALQTNTSPKRRKKTGNIFLMEPEPATLQEKRDAVMNLIFNPETNTYEPDGDNEQQPPLGGNNIDQQLNERFANDIPEQPEATAVAQDGTKAIDGAIGNETKQESTDNADDNGFQLSDKILSARERLMQTYRDRKVDPQSYRIDKPDKPQYDSERANQAKDLSRLNLIIQGLSALADVVGTSVSDEYVPVSTQNGLGIAAFNTLRNMNMGYRNRLDNYKDTVFDINKYNQQATREAEQFNQGIETDLAKQQLGFALKDEKMEQLKEQAINQAKTQEELWRRRAYIEQGDRLISQGQVPAAMQAYAQAGLNQDDIASMLGSGRRTGGGGMNALPEDFDPTTYSMYRRYKQLEQQIDPSELSTAARGEEFITSPKVREYMELKELLGTARYNPAYTAQYYDTTHFTPDEYTNEQDRNAFIARSTQRYANMNRPQQGQFEDELRGVLEKTNMTPKQIEKTMGDIEQYQKPINQQKLLERIQQAKTRVINSNEDNLEHNQAILRRLWDLRGASEGKRDEMMKKLMGVKKKKDIGYSPGTSPHMDKNARMAI